MGDTNPVGHAAPIASSSQVVPPADSAIILLREELLRTLRAELGGSMPQVPAPNRLNLALLEDLGDTKDKYRIKGDDVPKLKKDGSNYESWAAQVKLAFKLHPSNLLPIVSGELPCPTHADLGDGATLEAWETAKATWEEKNNAALYFLLSTMEEDRKTKHARETKAASLWATLVASSKTITVSAVFVDLRKLFHLRYA